MEGGWMEGRLQQLVSLEWSQKKKKKTRGEICRNSGTRSERQLLKPTFYFGLLLFLPEISGASGGGGLTGAASVPAEEGGSGRGQW